MGGSLWKRVGRADKKQVLRRLSLREAGERAAQDGKLRGRALVFMLAAVALGFPAAYAKDKAQPAPQWAVDAAKTPTPDSAKASPAVVLFDETLITVDDQNRAVERSRWAVRILKPQGRGDAQCGVGYDVDEKLNYFHSWTLAPDGRQFQALETDFKDVGASDSAVLQVTERVREVRPPGSDPGSVVACEWEEHLRPYFTEKMWRIQHEIPVVDQTFELVLPAGGHFATSWHRMDPVKPVDLGPNHLRWEIKDTAALDLENVRATPPWSALAARASIHWGEAAVQGTENQWHAIGMWQAQLEEHRHDPTPEITAKAQELVAGAPDLYTKLARITDFIQKNIRYFIVERGIGGWQPHYAGDIFRNRYGDCKDKATLLIAMLQAVGIPAHSLSVDSDRGFIDPSAPSRFGDHMIAAIELPDSEHDPRLMARVKAASGKWLLIFDPTDEVTPVGLIRSGLQEAWGYLANGAESQVLQIPVLGPDSAGVVRKGTFKLTLDGALSGDVSESFTGDDARSERSFLKENDSQQLHEKLEKGLGSELPGLAFKGFEFTRESELDHPLNLDLHLSAAGYAHSSGPLLLLRPRVLGTHAHVVPDVMEGKQREYPIELGHPGTWRDSYDIAIPDGYVVDDMPNPVSVDVDFASYHASVSAKGQVLHYESEYVVRDVEIPAAKAASFRQLESAILSNEKSSAVLKKQ